MSDIGHYDMIVKRRESVVKRLSPMAKHNAFPTIYATPIPSADPLKPLRLENERLKIRVKRLETENERLRAKVVLAEIKKAPAATVELILSEFCAALDCLQYRIDERAPTVSDITCHRRSQVYVRPRHVAMWLCVRLTGFSLPKIGHAFGGRDHTSLMHGRDKAQAIMDESPALKAAAMMVVAAIEARQ